MKSILNSQFPIPDSFTIPHSSQDVIVNGRPLGERQQDILLCSRSKGLVGQLPTNPRMLYAIALLRWVRRFKRGWADGDVCRLDCQTTEDIMAQAIRYNGQVKTLSEWTNTKYQGRMDYAARTDAAVRYRFGWDDDEILEGRLKHPLPIVLKNQCRTVQEWAELYEISPDIVAKYREKFLIAVARMHHLTGR